MRPRPVHLLMLAPAVAGVGGLFLAALVLGTLASFGVAPFAGDVAPTLEPYARAFAEPGLPASIALTVAMAGAVAALSAIMGVAAAVGAERLLRRGRGGLVVGLLEAALAVPHVVAALGVAALLSQSGFLSRIAYAAGLVGAPAGFPALTRDPGGVGILLAYLWKETPFVALVTLSLLLQVGREPAAVARSLGASRWQAFRHVTLPMVLPGVLPAAALVFAFTLGAYEIPSALGASHPQMLPVLAYRMYTSGEIADRPAAVALALATTLLALATLYAARGLHRVIAGRAA